MENKAEGYLLRAIGDDLYFDMTICLVASLRHYGDCRPVTLLTDNPKHPLLEEYSYMFDGIIDVNPFAEELNQRYSFTPRSSKRLLPDLLWHVSPYGRTIMLDSDMMAVRETEPLWNVSQNYNFTMLGCNPLLPGWGEMSDWDIQVTTDMITADREMASRLAMREVHAGIIWFDKSPVTDKVSGLLKEAFLGDKMEKYFPKVFKMWNGPNNEMALVYAMSVLDLPVIPYYRNLMSVNPTYFSVMDGVADMGDFTQGKVYQLAGKMEFVESTPVLVHLFKKANDPGYWRNRRELYEWVNVMMPGANLNFLG